MSVSSNILDESFRKLLQEDVKYEDEIESPIDNDEEFPTTSIRVLLVDADPNSLLFMNNLMTQFSYQVTKYESGEEAISFLTKSKHEIDLVIWDFHSPNINGLDALNTIVKDMDLPVVIMSHDYSKETVMKSTKYGACDFLVKPVSKEVVAVLWQHVFRKRMSKSGLSKPDKSDTVESDADDDELYQSNEEGSKNNSGDKSLSKKPRMTWTPELHHKFELAVAKIGSLENAYPKQILKEMNVPGLTRNNVASHLQRLRWQKYRLNSNKKTRTETEQDGWRNPGQNAALAVSNPLLNPSINLHAIGSYQAAVNAPIQYPSTSYLPMNNNNNNDFISNAFPYLENIMQPQQQQYYSSLQLPSVLTKQELGHRSSSAMDNSGQLIYNTTLPFDHNEYFLPGLNFDQNGRFDSPI